MDIIKNRKDWNVSKFLFDSRYTEMKKKATTKMKSTPTKCSYYCDMDITRLVQLKTTLFACSTDWNIC